jgi:flagellar hook-basal body complex protein FliE
MPKAVQETARTEKSPTFGKFLQDAVDQVNELQNQSDAQIRNFMAGKGTDIHTVMMAVNKADISFQMMLQVRNKLVTAYQEIMRMQG